MDERAKNRRMRSRRNRRKQLIRRVTIFLIVVTIIVGGTIIGIDRLQSEGIIGEQKSVEIKRDIPLLFQHDSRWADKKYGDSDIKTAGCAPTCIAMVVRGITKNKDITPRDVARFAEKNGYYVEGVGTQWTLMTEGCREYKIKGKEISLDKSLILKYLNKGQPIICSVGPGDFTTEGHFIVLEGLKDEKIIINDPNSLKRSNKLWKYEEIETQIKNLWVFKS
ncbi:MAG: C39 family peptidase [Eubacterium sp.]|nr:C39 family peptidase [Eubacterium sp.]